MDLLWASVELHADRIDYKEYAETDTYRYFENMSEALARMTSGTAYVKTLDCQQYSE